MKNLAYLLLAGGALCAFAPVTSLVAKPNIVYILADDLGYGDLGCYGQQYIKTPNLDLMAAEGMRFMRHYAGATVCAPSRCALMTGKHTGHCPVRGNVDVLMKDDEPTLGKTLQAAGYATACIGKWGIGHPPPPDDPAKHGFDYFYGYLSMWHAHNYYPDFLWRNGEKVPLRNVVRHPEKHYKENQAELVGLATEKRDYAPDLFLQEALSFIEKQSGRPFFLFFTPTIPHANNEASQFGSHGMEIPDLGAYAGETWPEPEKAKAAMISRLDADVGRILAKLVDLKLDRNTLVLFSSDNGPHKEGGVKPGFLRSSGPLRGTKRDLYEGGIRVPMIAWWPGTIESQRIAYHVSAFWDVLPTLAEVAGARPPRRLDGISFLPTLLAKQQKLHDYLYWEFHEGSSKQAVLLGDWKAVKLAPSQPAELYNLIDDPAEQRNIAPNHPLQVMRMENLMKKARSGQKTWPLQDSAPTMSF